MSVKNWEQLKSGSDVRGTAIEGVAGEPVNLTDEAVGAIVKASSPSVIFPFFSTV